MINVFCRDWGWLFEDLKRDIAAVADDVVASDEPLPDADAWICVRTDEAVKCPDLSRCVVQVHDFRERRVEYSPGAVSRVHESTGALWHPATGKSPEILVLPIGARRLFTLRESMPERFTVGFVGRDVVHNGRHIKRPQLFVDAVLEARRQGVEVNARMYGPVTGPGNIFEYADQLQDIDQKTYIYPHKQDRAESLRDFYHSIDALVVTCEPEPGPLSAYEALACGVPVVLADDLHETSFAVDPPAPTGRGWVFRCTVGDSPAQRLARAIESASHERFGMFRDRAEVREWNVHWQDDWCSAQVELARSLCR